MMNNKTQGDLTTAKRIGETLIFSLSEEQKLDFVSYMLMHVDASKISDIREDMDKSRIKNLLKEVEELRPSDCFSLEFAKAIAVDTFEKEARFDHKLDYSHILKVELIKGMKHNRDFYEFIIHYVGSEGCCWEYKTKVERKKEYTVKVK